MSGKRRKSSSSDTGRNSGSRTHSSSSSGSNTERELWLRTCDRRVSVTCPRYRTLTHRISQPTHQSHPHLMREGDLTPWIKRAEFERRREKVFQKMAVSSALILVGSGDRLMSGDAPYSFRQESSLMYLTGIMNERGCMAVLTKSSMRQCRFLLFIPKRQDTDVVWTGLRLGKHGALVHCGANRAFELSMASNGSRSVSQTGSPTKKKRNTNNNNSNTHGSSSHSDRNSLLTPGVVSKREVQSQLRLILSEVDTVYFDSISEPLCPIVDYDLHCAVVDVLIESKREKSSIKCGVYRLIEELRARKSESEMELINASVQITCLSMIDAMRYCAARMRYPSKRSDQSAMMIHDSHPHSLYESELQVRMEMGCRLRGAKRLSYLSAVSNGPHSRILRYYSNDSPIQPGQMVLMDFGCELHGYCSDITRTFPSTGRFSAAQRVVYELVLEVSDHLLNHCCLIDGQNCVSKMEEECESMLKRRMMEMGILHKRYAKRSSRALDSFVHGNHLLSSSIHYVAHFIGLDCHDCNRVPVQTPFEAGMALSIEPGLYLGDFDDINPEYRDISVRIEDNILLTENGPMLLSKILPRTVEEIEQCMDVSMDDDTLMNSHSMLFNHDQPSSLKRYDLLENLEQLSNEFQRERKAMINRVMKKKKDKNEEMNIDNSSMDHSSPTVNHVDSMILSSQHNDSNDDHPHHLPVSEPAVMSLCSTNSTSPCIDCSSLSSTSSSLCGSPSSSNMIIEDDGINEGSNDSSSLLNNNPIVGVPRKKIQRTSIDVVHHSHINPSAVAAVSIPSSSLFGMSHVPSLDPSLHSRSMQMTMMRRIPNTSRLFFTSSPGFPFGAGSLPIRLDSSSSHLNTVAHSMGESRQIRRGGPIQVVMNDHHRSKDLINVSTLSDDSSDEGSRLSARVAICSSSSSSISGSKRPFTEMSDGSLNMDDETDVPRHREHTEESRSDTTPTLFFTRQPKLTGATSLFAETIGGSLSTEPGAPSFSPFSSDSLLQNRSYLETGHSITSGNSTSAMKPD